MIFGLLGKTEGGKENESSLKVSLLPFNGVCMIGNGLDLELLDKLSILLLILLTPVMSIKPFEGLKPIKHKLSKDSHKLLSNVRDSS